MLRALFNPLCRSDHAKTHRMSIFCLKVSEKSKTSFKFLYNCLNLMPFKIQYELNLNSARTYIGSFVLLKKPGNKKLFQFAP